MGVMAKTMEWTEGFRKVLQDILVPELRGIKVELEDHGNILREHGQILREHGQILREHGQILREHGQILREHGKRLDNIDQKLEGIDHRLASMEKTQERLLERLNWEPRIVRIETILEKKGDLPPWPGSSGSLP